MGRLQIEDILKIFTDEFGTIAEKFTIIQCPTKNIHFNKCSQFIENNFQPKDVTKNFELEYIVKPGVYVIWKELDDSFPSNIIKVGRHLRNSRFRAFQHLDAYYADYDTKSLFKDSEAKILLFNLIKTIKDENKIIYSDKHWAAALEIFFEENLHPIINSKRLG